MSNPYRRALPVVHSGPVFCKDCRWYRYEHFSPYEICSVPTFDSDPVSGMSSARVRNEKRDCTDFEPRRPWWARLLGLTP